MQAGQEFGSQRLNVADGHPKRLIEVDLPIGRISMHARREKAINQGHVRTLHVWWARRPLAACRAVVCAALWPDPADEFCSEGFREAARKIMLQWARQLPQSVDSESFLRFSKIKSNPEALNNSEELRNALLDFIADFSRWENSVKVEYLRTSRELTTAAHESLGGLPGTRPLIIDPFAGGGAIPLESLRVGADAFAGDLNPVAVLLNKVALELVPRYGERLVEETQRWGEQVKEEAWRELRQFYPPDPDGARPIAYLWARTIQCEGPGCDSEVPLLRNLWLSSKRGSSAALVPINLEPGAPIRFDIVNQPARGVVGTGFTAGNSATCPACGYTTPVARVRQQLRARRGGSHDGRLVSVVTKASSGGRKFRLVSSKDYESLQGVEEALSQLEEARLTRCRLIPDEHCPPEGSLGFRIQKYGIVEWRDLYTPRQLLTLCTFAKIISGAELRASMREEFDDDFVDAILTLLSISLSRMNDRMCTLCRWRSDNLYVEAANGGQNKMSMLLDFAEANPFAGSSGDWTENIHWVTKAITHVIRSQVSPGVAIQAPAQSLPLPDESADACITDPPYYDAFGYSDLSEFFYIWLRRTVPEQVIRFNDSHPPKTEEAISVGADLGDGRGLKDNASYASAMEAAFRTSRRLTKPNGISVVVFANKTTSGWEAILNSLIDAGWTATASWPIDTELQSRQRALGAAALNSSVHIVLRPREDDNGVLISDYVGDWRDVLQELPQRIGEWMPRLAREGVVGADAIFACLGPALEIFSRYS